MFKKADISKFDPNGAGDTNANVFGLNFTSEESNVILIPVPWEATASYGKGTAEGPHAIWRASPQLDLFDAELARMGLGRPWEFGIHMEPQAPEVREMNRLASKFAKPVIENGGAGESRKLKEALAVVNELSAKLNDWIFARTEKWLDHSKIVGIVGGEHSVSFGAIKSCASRFPSLGILHIDAHADLRDAYEGFTFSHASIMHNVIHRIPEVEKLVQIGIRDFCDSEYELSVSHPKIKTWFDFDLREQLFRGRSYADVCKEIVEALPQHVYVSFDIDGLDPALCPHTGTPVPGGLSFLEGNALIKAVVESGRKIVAFDLNEVAPSPRKSEEWDGNVGARILYKLCGLALASHGAKN